MPALLWTTSTCIWQSCCGSPLKIPRGQTVRRFRRLTSKSVQINSKSPDSQASAIQAFRRRLLVSNTSLPEKLEQMQAPSEPCLQVLSDIHLEFKRSGKGFDFPVTAPYLCLLGDIGDPGSKKYADFLHTQAKRFDQVFILKGNHSCYGRTLEEADVLISSICSAHPDKLKYLNRSAVPLGDDHVILGCTLWSHVTDQQRSMVSAMLADYRHIRNWSVQRNNEVHALELTWLQQALAEVEAAEKLAIVLTHHAPSFHGTSAPQHKDSPISSAFCTDLEHMCKLPVVLWMFGHTHYSSNQRINGVRVNSNQVGYPGEGVKFDPAFIVQLDT